jgi:hypothetical protein
MTTKTTTTKKTTTRTTAKSGAERAPKKAAVVAENLPSNPFAFEVLALMSKQRSNAKKIEILKKYEDPSLKAIFIWNFDDTIISVLPPGQVPYSSTKEQTAYSGTLSGKIEDAVNKMGEMGSNSLGSQDQGFSSIRKEYKMFYNFLKGGNDSLSSLRRETMFINILEGLHPLEAEILILVKDKKLQDKYSITKEIVSSAYPDIVWGGRS